MAVASSQAPDAAEAARIGAPFLGEVPLEMAIRATSDAGTPIVAKEPDGPHAAHYRAIADNYHLTSGEMASIAARVAELDQTITGDCKAGRYRFDLVPSVILGQAKPPAEVACE